MARVTLALAQRFKVFGSLSSHPKRIYYQLVRNALVRSFLLPTMEGKMKKFKFAVAVAALSIAAAAQAMPAAVPDIYYSKLPHRWAVLSGNDGFCGTPIGAQAPICWEV
jgi:hypothetical protein